MEKSRLSLIIVSLVLVCSMVFNLSGCSMEVQAQNLMDNIKPNHVETLDKSNSYNADVTDFAIRLFKKSEESGKNTLISPLSVLYALAMTANGSEGETLQQMETVLGMKTEELNKYLYSYMKKLPQNDYYKFNLANSIWFTEDEHFKINQDFLQTNADYYGADIYKAPFNNQTLKDINNWVNKKTDKMIPKILDELPPEAVMCLVNALVFDAEWSEIYQENDVEKGKFTKEDGTKQNAEFMRGMESIYLEDEKATGFMKHYRDDKYAFVAMLPKEEISISEYIASLNGESVNKLLTNPQYTLVSTELPKFETEYTVEMPEILKNMGMPKAFNEKKAEFKKLGTSIDGNIFIENVIHKTFISVNEKGTKAGAATAVMIYKEALSPINIKKVHLNRPFVYMLIDCENNIPFFIGTMMDIKK